MGMRMVSGAGLLAAALVALPAGARAAEDGDPVARYLAWKQGLKDDGFEFAINYTSEDLAAVSGGSSDALVHAGQLSVNAKADMDKLVGWNGASFSVSVSHRDGDNVNVRDGIGALLGPQEIFGRGNVTRVSQFWLDQKLFGDRVTLRLGRVNAGSDFEEFDCNFINLSYCGNQVGNIVSDYWFNYPISQWGAIAKVKTSDTTYLKAGAYQVNPDNLKTGVIHTLNFSHGTGTLIPVEFGWTPKLGGKGGEATVKLGGWYSTASRADVYLDADRNSAAATGNAFLQRSGSYGGYISAVAKVPTGPRDGGASLMGFFNAALADSRTSTVDRTFAVGVVYTGAIPGRPKDQIGLAASYNHLNQRLSDYRRETLALGGTALQPGTGENAVELYYGLQLGELLQFRPDVQWVRHPGGISSNPDALIVGARTSVTF